MIPIDDNFAVRLGIVLARYRERKGFSQEYIGEQLGYTKMMVSLWESGKRGIYAKTLKRYCALLGVTVQQVFDEADAEVLPDAGV